MTLQHWTIYLLAAAGLSLTPGPNGLLALTHGMRFGWRRSVATLLGGAVGFLLLIAISMVGLGALLAASERAFTVAKWLGAAYLVYLGLKTWRAPVGNTGAGGTVFAQQAPAHALFRDGFLVATSNPKAVIFFAAFLPQFMVPGMAWPVQFMVLGGTFAVVEFAYELLLAGSAHRVAPWLQHHARAVNRAAGGMFVGIGIALATLNRAN
ncbi:MAG TPA: LysE family transporter [Salinisphaeraceae bacterium]|nr:LysE family transporter [Salinisphaeraceae bacterium]